MPVAEFELLVKRQRLRPSQARQILTGAVPIVILGVLAAACILEHAEWKGDASSMSTSQLWGGDSAEEANHDEAITIAEHIDKGAVNAGTPPPIDPEIMKEVEKAEAEQAKESSAEAAFAAGKTPEPAEASAPAGSSDSGAGDAGAAAAPAANGAGPDAVDAAASAAPVAAAPVVAPHPAPAATAA